MTSYIYDMVDTWNAGATTFTAVKMNVTDTASAAGSLLMDLQVGGSSRFSVSKQYGTSLRGAVGNYLSYAIFGTSDTQPRISMSDTTGIAAFMLGPGGSTVLDTFLTRRAAANLRLGAADVTGDNAAASLKAQTLSVQSVASGGTLANVAGANFTITGSQGTGTGAGGSIVFQVAPAGSSGTAQNALVNSLSLTSAGIANMPSTNGVGGFALASELVFARLGAYTGLMGPNGGSGILFAPFGSTNTGWAIIGSTRFAVSSGHQIAWSSTAEGVGTPDTILARDAANTLALRNGANAQTFRVYNTTDGTNSEFGKIAWSSNVLQIGTEKAGTGTARALEFQTDGTTRLTIAAAGGTLITQSQATTATLTVRNTGNAQFTAGIDQLAPSLGVTSSFGFTIGRNAATNNWASIYFYYAGDGSASNRLDYYFYGTSARMSLLANGNLGIGTTSPSEKLEVAGNIKIGDYNLVSGTTTGTKIGTATTQKIGFFNAAPVVQPTAVADATDNATAITQLNALLSRMRDLGLIAT